MYSSIGINRGNLKKVLSSPPPLTKNLSNHPLKNLSLNNLHASSAVIRCTITYIMGTCEKVLVCKNAVNQRKNHLRQTLLLSNSSPTIYFFLFPDPTKVKQVNFLSMWDFIYLVDISEKINLIIKKWFFFLKSHKSFWKVLEVL